jgi:NAD(P)-dependent dehydrogenase (short-subunit alcohol dehydrogenase family)
MTNPYQALFDLTGRSAVVMGAGSGIGAGTARVLAGLGARVLCADVNEEGAQAVVQEISEAGGTAIAMRADLSAKADVTAVLDTAIDEFGRIDIAVTTPGINIRKRIADFTDDEFDRIINLNLKGTFHFLQQSSVIMAEQGSGSIIACSSMRAVLVEPGLAVYAATKAAVQQMVRGLASEVGARGVRVNSIAPGVIDTPLTRPLRDKPEVLKAYDEHTSLGRWGTADEVGAAVAFLASDAASYITGTNLPVDAGWTAIDGRFDPQR